MRLVKWSPMMPPMFQDFNDMFEDFSGNTSLAGNFSPAVDVYEKDNQVVVETPLPGIDAQNLKISIENDVLSIEGSSEKKSEIDEKNYYRKEVRYGSFHRAVALPCSVDGDKADADYKDGMLRVTIPKAAVAQKKTIKVSTK
ncbi:MAG: Hsp20/alpha crystallin family protein [Candidatus Kerfeldbacteria bacterium]|nr:Hsp20/alpha crystallin family protein [Candidatus Kerfeldbacteria bacterium]